MEVRIQSIHFDASEQLQAFIQKKVSKLEKYYEEIVEVGELGPEEIDVPAPVIDMIYERTGEKRPMCPMWQRAKAKAEGGQ